MTVIQNFSVRTQLKCLYSHQEKCLVYDGFHHHGLDINIDADHNISYRNFNWWI